MRTYARTYTYVRIRTYVRTCALVSYVRTYVRIRTYVRTCALVTTSATCVRDVRAYLPDTTGIRATCVRTYPTPLAHVALRSHLASSFSTHRTCPRCVCTYVSGTTGHPGTPDTTTSEAMLMMVMMPTVMMIICTYPMADRQRYQWQRTTTISMATPGRPGTCNRSLPSALACLRAYAYMELWLSQAGDSDRLCC